VNIVLSNYAVVSFSKQWYSAQFLLRVDLQSRLTKKFMHVGCIASYSMS